MITDFEPNFRKITKKFSKKKLGGGGGNPKETPITVHFRFPGHWPVKHNARRI